MRLSSTQSPHKLILQTTHPSHFLAPPPPPPPPLLLPFHSSTTILPKHANFSCISNSRGDKDSGSEAARPVFFSGRASLNRLKVNAVGKESDVPEWWEKKSGPNMVDIHSTQDFVDELSKAGDRLVIVDFYGTWCASCRAMFPKLCKTAEMHPEIMFLKVNFDANKSLCKSLNIKVLPYFHFYRGADRLLDSFSCSLAKFQKLKDAIATHNCVSMPSEVDQKLSGQKRLEIPPALNDKPSEPTHLYDILLNS